MKKIGKFLLRTILGLFLILLLTYSGFRAKEHLSGNDYYEYLISNVSSSSIGETPDFSLMTKDIQDARLILVGEIHGFQVPTEFDPQFFEHLVRSHGVAHYLVEMDWAQAHFLNKYNETGEEHYLDSVMQHWVVTIGRENTDYRNKWKALREVYLHTGSFTYLGNNGISDIELLGNYLQTQYGLTIPEYGSISDSLQLVRYQEQLLSQFEETELPWELRYIDQNISYYLENKYREEVLTANLIQIYDHLDLYKAKVYGYYGLGHTVLNSFDDGYQAMASRFIDERPSMKGRVLSSNFVFVDSKMTTYSKNQPRFLRDEGKYTFLPTSFDNIWLSYLHGIDELKRLTSENSVSLIRLNGEQSPYRHSRRLSTMSKLLPFGLVLNAKEDLVTTDYYQYLILVRNSEGAVGD